MNELVVAMEIKTNSGFNGLELPRLWGGPSSGVGKEYGHDIYSCYTRIAHHKTLAYHNFSGRRSP